MKFVRNLDIRRHTRNTSNIDSVRSIIHASRLRIHKTFETKNHFLFLKNKRRTYRVTYRWWKILIHIFITVIIKNNILHEMISGRTRDISFFFSLQHVEDMWRSLSLLSSCFFNGIVYFIRIKDKEEHAKRSIYCSRSPCLSYLVNFINFIQFYTKQFLLST